MTLNANQPSSDDELFVFTCAPGNTVPLLDDLNTTLRGGIFCPIYRTWTRVGRLRIRTQVTRALIPGLLFVRGDQFRAAWDERHLSPMRRLNAKGEPTGWAACLGQELEVMYSKAEELDYEFQSNPFKEDIDPVGSPKTQPRKTSVKEEPLPAPVIYDHDDFPAGTRVLLQGGLLHLQTGVVQSHKRDHVEILMDGARFPVVVSLSSLVPISAWKTVAGTEEKGRRAGAARPAVRGTGRDVGAAELGSGLEER